MRSIIWWPMAVRAGHYKLMLTSPGATPQLFDLAADPTEAIDISAREPGLTRALHADLLAWHTERFRSDPSFGYRFPPLSRLIASRPRVEGVEWVKVPPSADPSPSPGRPPSPVQ
jgi:hypothetical protein